MKKPPARIKVLAKKYDNDIVRVELVDIPEHVKFSRLREEKEKGEVEKKGKAHKKEEIKEEKVEKREEAKKEETEEKKVEAKEKEEASKEEGLKHAKEQAIAQKHISKDSKVMMPRKTLSR